MAKPATFDGYSNQHTVDCERVLVTLLRGPGPWNESVFLVGPLASRPGRLRDNRGIRASRCMVVVRFGRVRYSIHPQPGCA